MKQALIKATQEALRKVINPRFYRSERGFQGEFYCRLKSELEVFELMDDGTILEMEYQKRLSSHRTRQRPDIIFHIPTEHSGRGKDGNNLAVWALKHRNNCHVDEVLRDLGNLDEMFISLKYAFGFFIVIDEDKNFLDYYDGEYKSQIISFSTKLLDGEPSVIPFEFK